MQPPHHPGDDEVAWFDEGCGDEGKGGNGEPDDHEAHSDRLPLLQLSLDYVFSDFGEGFRRDRW